LHPYQQGQAGDLPKNNNFIQHQTTTAQQQLSAGTIAARGASFQLPLAKAPDSHMEADYALW